MKERNYLHAAPPRFARRRSPHPVLCIRSFGGKITSFHLSPTEKIVGVKMSHVSWHNFNKIKIMIVINNPYSNSNGNKPIDVKSAILADFHLDYCADILNVPF